MCLRNIDHDYVTFFNLQKGEEGSFSTYPEEWCTRYLSQKYDEHDYVHLKNSFLPIVWGEAHTKNISPLQKKIFKEAEDFQIYKGITIPFFASISPEFMTLAFSKREKLSQNKVLRLTCDLQFIYQMIITYKSLLESEHESQDATLKLIEEVVAWQKMGMKKKLSQESAIQDVLSDIRTAQLFITHHETKELGLETLHRAYKDIERLL